MSSQSQPFDCDCGCDRRRREQVRPDSTAERTPPDRPTTEEVRPLRDALERLLAVAMTEEEDVSPATQDEWIAAIQQADRALNAALPAQEPLDVERLAKVLWDASADAWPGRGALRNHYHPAWREYAAAVRARLRDEEER